MSKWKIFALVVMSVLGFACTSNADTISFWHVYYNQVKIRDYNVYSQNAVIKFRVDSIQPADSLTVQYFDDTPCPCAVTLVIQDQQGNAILTRNGRSTHSPITFSLFALSEISSTGKQYDFTVYFIEGELGSSQPKIPLFTIHLE